MHVLLVVTRCTSASMTPSDVPTALCGKNAVTKTKAILEEEFHQLCEVRGMQ